MMSNMLIEPVVSYTTNVGGVCRIGHVKVSSSQAIVN